MGADISPKTFISYSWSSPEHEEWVLNLASELRESGVDVILDKWDLKEGHDAHAFMERMVTDSDIKKVMLICDQAYAIKADNRSGGVGTEAQIVSSEVYTKVEQDKFAAILAERDESGQACLPTYFKSRIYIDLSTDEEYATNFEKLLRWIFDKPFYQKPVLGKPPGFLEENESVSLGVSHLSKRVIDGFRNSKPYALGALSEYVSAVAENFERFRIVSERHDNEFDERFIESIDSFVPARNELIEVFSVIAQYDSEERAVESLHRLFELLAPYMKRPEGVSTYHEWDFDNFKFIINELFLYVLALSIKYRRYQSACFLLENQYYIEQYENSNVRGYTEFRQHLSVLEHRNTRLKLNRLSVHADLLEKRNKGSGVSFQDIMQTDFICYMREVIQCEKQNSYGGWWPVTLLYWSEYSGPSELFARAKSTKHFDQIKGLLAVTTKDEIVSVVDLFESGKIDAPRWGWNRLQPRDMLAIDDMCKLP